MKPHLHILFCILLTVFLAGSHITRELDVPAPFFSVTLMSYATCLCLTVLWKKAQGLFWEEGPDINMWDPLMSTENTRTLFFMVMCFALQSICSRISRAYCTDTQNSWAVDIWCSFIPIFVAIMTGGVSNDDVLITSGGTSLAITCGTVLMLPSSAFGGYLQAHTFALLEALFASGAIVVAHRLLTNKEAKATPLDLMLHGGSLIPLVLVIPIGLLEIPLILQYFKRPWIYIFGKGFIDTLMLLVTQGVMYVMLMDTPPLFVSGIYGVATAFAILLTSSVISLVGFVCVLGAFAVHTKILVYSRKERLYSEMSKISERPFTTS